MPKAYALSSGFLLSIMVGCANTAFKPWEARNNAFEGSGGTKTVVDGMEIWDNGEPPRKLKILRIIDDVRPGGILPMSALQGDIVRKARAAGGDAVIQIGSQSEIAGSYSTGSASAFVNGNSATAYGSSTSVPLRRNVAKFAVIKYLD